MFKLTPSGIAILAIFCLFIGINNTLEAQEDWEYSDGNPHTWSDPEHWGDGETPCGNITISNGSTLTITANFEMTGDLDIDGNGSKIS